MTKSIMFEGETHEFPDDFTPEDISAALNSLPKTEPKAQIQGAPSAAESLLHGAGDFARGVTQLNMNSGYAPPADNGDETARRDFYAEGGTKNPAVQQQAQNYNKEIAADERDYQQRRGQPTWSGYAPSSDAMGMDESARREHFSTPQKPVARPDAYRMVGGIIGSAPLLALPGGAATLPRAVASGVMSGVATAASQPVVDDTKPYWDQKRDQMLEGGAAGGVFSGLLNLGSRAISPNVSADVKLLQEKNVKLTPGMATGVQQAEDKLTSLPIVGKGVINQQRRATESLNVAAYNEALQNVGEQASGKVGHEGIAEVGDKLGQAYDATVPHLKLNPDADLMSAIQDAGSLVSGMSEDKAAQFQKLMQQGMPRGPLEGDSLKTLQSKIAKEIGRFGKSEDPSDQMISEGLEQVRDAIMENLAKTNPQYSEKLSAINKGWAILTRLEKAAAGTEDGVFTGKQLLSAVRQSDNTVRKRGFARGGALLQDLAGAGARVVGSRYPNSGTAGRTLPWLMGAGAGYGMATAPSAVIAGGSALGMGRLAYTDAGSDLLTAALTKRFKSAPKVADAIRKGSVPATLAISNLLLGN